MYKPLLAALAAALVFASAAAASTSADGWQSGSLSFQTTTFTTSSVKVSAKVSGHQAYVYFQPGKLLLPQLPANISGGKADTVYTVSTQCADGSWTQATTRKGVKLSAKAKLLYPLGPKLQQFSLGAVRINQSNCVQAAAPVAVKVSLAISGILLGRTPSGGKLEVYQTFEQASTTITLTQKHSSGYQCGPIDCLPLP